MSTLLQRYTSGVINEWDFMNDGIIFIKNEGTSIINVLILKKKYPDRAVYLLSALCMYDLVRYLIIDKFIMILMSNVKILTQHYTNKCIANVVPTS